MIHTRPLTGCHRFGGHHQIAELRECGVVLSVGSNDLADFNQSPRRPPPHGTRAGVGRASAAQLRPADGATMKHDDLISVECWHSHGNALVRELEVRDFDESVTFANGVAEEAVDYGRRPELTVTLDRVRIVVADLYHLPLARAEVRLAHKVDAVLAEHRREP